MAERIVSQKMQIANELRWLETRKPELLQMLKRVDERVWKCITTNEITPKYSEQLGSCYMYGAVGTGKSVSAAWRMLEWSRLRARFGKLGTNALFVNTGELLEELRQGFNSKNGENTYTRIIELKKIDLLVLDDLAVVKSTDFVYQTLYSIINYRYSHFKPTFCTCNHNLIVLASKLEDDRLTSRIEHDCGDDILFFDRKSKRKVK